MTPAYHRNRPPVGWIRPPRDGEPERWPLSHKSSASQPSACIDLQRICRPSPGNGAPDAAGRPCETSGPDSFIKTAEALPAHGEIGVRISCELAQTEIFSMPCRHAP